MSLDKSKLLWALVFSVKRGGVGQNELAAASNPKPVPGRVPGGRARGGSLNPAGRRRRASWLRAAGAGRACPPPGRGVGGAGTRTGTGDGRPESEGARARARGCPRRPPPPPPRARRPRAARPEAAARAAASTSCGAASCRSRSAARGPGRRGPRPRGAEMARGGSAREARRSRLPGGGRAAAAPPPTLGLRPASRPGSAPPRPRAPPRLLLEALGLALTLEGAGPTGQSVNCAETCPDPRLRGFRAQFSEFLA